MTSPVPSAFNSLHACSQAFASLDEIYTFAPLVTKPSDIMRPIPFAPPVTRTTLSCVYRSALFQDSWSLDGVICNMRAHYLNVEQYWSVHHGSEDSDIVVWNDWRREENICLAIIWMELIISCVSLGPGAPIINCYELALQNHRRSPSLVETCTKAVAKSIRSFLEHENN